MSGSDKQPKDDPSNEAAVPQLDVSKLHALPTEQQELYLLTYVSDLRNHATSLSSEALPPQQAAIKKEVIKIVGLGTPAPSRVIRHNLGRILADIFDRGSRQLLLESVSDLLAVINAGKSEKDLGSRHVATTCMGLLFQSAGDSAIGPHGLVVSSLLKLSKMAQAHTGFRASLLRSLGQVVEGLNSSIDEQVARDIWKFARNSGPGDKSGLVQKHACLCIRSLYQHTSYFVTSNDFENLKTVIWKVMESNNASTRMAAARALASAMLTLHNDKVSENVPIVRKPKKVPKKKDVGSDDDMEIEAPGTTSNTRSSTRLSLGLIDLLRVLSNHYGKASTSNKARSGLAVCYKYVLEGLPEKVVREHYGNIADHFFNDVVSHPSIMSNRYRVLLTRKYVQILLGDVVASSLLSETGQINAARWLINDVLKNYPRVMQDRKEPSKRTLAAALQTLSHLLLCLGPAASSIQDSCREALFQVSQHLNYTVQVHVAKCFRSFVSVCQGQLVKSIDQALSQAKKEFEPGEGHSYRRATAYAMSIAAMLRAARDSPLYGTIDLFSSLFSFATDLLKSSASSELRVCATQVQTSWTIIGGLMALGPSFVKVHLNQLLLLWRNALPPPLTQDNTTRRGQLELSFLAHVRECALAALFTFLLFNHSLITVDGSKRIAAMLQNSNVFLDSLPSTRQTEDPHNRLLSALQLHDFAVMLRRRILQCMVRLTSLRHLDLTDLTSQSDIAGMSLRTFTTPDRPLYRNLEASLATSASNFEGIWELGDNWGFGVTGLLHHFRVRLPTNGTPNEAGLLDTSTDPLEASLMSMPLSPMVSSLEHDSVLMCINQSSQQDEQLYAPETACVDAAIHLFAVALPLQIARVQESSLEQLATILAQAMPRDPGRKFSMQLNAATAILCALAVANGETSFPRGKFAVQTTSKITAEIIRRCILDPDSIARSVAAQALGRLCNLAGAQFTGTEVKHLVDTVVANRDPHVRAGCALALGLTHSQVGAMAASFHLNTIVGVLLSLCSDGHPVVHFWALQGLREVADSAGLSFSAYVTSTLGMLAQLYSSDNHNEESILLASSNTELDHPTPLLVGQCIDSLINVLGPDLQDVAKARNLILTLVQYFQLEDSSVLQGQSQTCLNHVSLYAPAHVQLSKYVRDLQTSLMSGQVLLEQVAITGLEQLVKRNAGEVFRVASLGFGDQLWASLDKYPDNQSLQGILRMWMQQTCLIETLEWVERCQTILSKTRVRLDAAAPPAMTKTAKSTIPDLADEEVAGFAAAAAAAEGEKAESAPEGQEFLRWQTRNFAMHLLSELLDVVRDAMLPDQVIPAEAALQSKVAEIVRVAFSASTATVVELRIRGLHIIDQILNLFGRTPDPDFLEASLLEQYQAQIASALTPAFAADSSPELAAEAIAVCATFVATGIVTNVDRMGRIFKVLSTSLDNFAQVEPEAAIGDLQSLSPNAQSMLKMAVLSGWAQLQLASVDQGFLEDIVQPFVPKLAPMWLSSLQEFAGLRFEPEISTSLGEYSTNNLRERYAAFDREVRLKFYQRSWLSLVDAIALLVEKDSDAVFDALDNRQVSDSHVEVNGDAHGKSGRDMSFREEPVAFFFILFGLAYEALVTQAREDPLHALSILHALKKILTPAVSGHAVYQDAIFNETTDTLDRLALTSPADTQAVLVEIARNLSLDHVVAKAEGRDDKLSDDIDQLFELTRIIILVLTGLVPTLEEPAGQAIRSPTDDHVSLIHKSFKALVDVSEVFPAIIRADLHACVIHCYCAISATGVCQAAVVPRTMPVFRSFWQQTLKASHHDGESTARLVRGCLYRLLTVLGFAQRRENEFSIPCAKNTLLSIAVLLTTASAAVPPNDDLVVKTLLEMLECLQDVGLAKIAASCIRSLLSTNPKTPCDETVCRYLWPKILHFVMSPDEEDPESVKTGLMQSLVSSVSSLGTSQGKFAAVSILVPCLLTRARQPVPNGSTEDLNKESARRLLELVTIDGAAFRSTVVQLDDAQRSQLETLLRSAGLGARQRTRTESSEEARPAIALRMDF